MDDQYEKEYMHQHDMQVTIGIHKVVRLTFLIGPLLYLLTQLHIFKIETETCIFWGVI